jgi:peptidoglycan/xylan/chitin deacetylase (PgdA/CDA1 family)
MYHAIRRQGICDDGMMPGQNVYTLDEKDFAQQIGLLGENRYRSITIPDLIAQHELYETNRRSVVLTFDDGYISDYEIASEHLEAGSFHAAFFVTVDFLGRKGHMDWQKVRELDRTGHVIGSHGMTHRYLSDLDDNEVEEELSRSKGVIEDKKGGEVTALSLPGGRGDMRVLRIARNVGYSAVCTSSIGAGTIEDGFLVLNRIAIKRNMSLGSFHSMVRLSPGPILRSRVVSSSRSLVARMLGNRRYDALRNRILAVSSPR